MAGVTVRTFLVDGLGSGVRTMELSNRTILATLFPRHALDRFSKLTQAGRPGVYILLGEEAGESAAQAIYIGEGDPLQPRLRDHGASKEFWAQAVTLTSKDDYLTKTQIQYLESRLYDLARAAGRVTLENKKRPEPPTISTADQEEMDDFLASIRLLLQTAGLGFLESRSVPESELSVSVASGNDESFEYRIKVAVARMLMTSAGFVVLKGSTALFEQPAYGAKQASTVRAREELVAAGILVRSASDPSVFDFAQNAAFDSPSAAATAVAGGGQNGLVCWRRERDKKTLKEVLQERAGASAAGSLD